MRKFIILSVGLAAFIALSGCHKVTTHHRRHHQKHPHVLLPEAEKLVSQIDQLG